MGFVKKAAFVVFAAVGVFYMQSWMAPKVPTNVNGFCLPRFAQVKDAFRENLESGTERGGAFAVYHKGELVCDLWGGFADEYIEYPWQENTVSSFFSATKSVCSILIIMLADRGLLDFEMPVAHYWPEFAQNGKENVTVKMLVTHQAGLAAIDEKFSIRLVKSDPDKVGKILAAQAPNWPPGSMSGYHALSWGLYLDQLLRRIDKKHRGIDQFFREEVGIPFDIDFFIGLPREEHYRAARFMEFTEFGSMISYLRNPETRKLFYNMLTDPLSQGALHMEDAVKYSRYYHSWPEYKQVPHGSMYGYGTARSLAKFYGILTNGGKLGDRVLLSSAWTSRLTEVVWSGVDRVLGVELQRGYAGAVFSGYGGAPQTVFGHGGYGGQIGYGDVAESLGWAYLTTYPTATLGSNIQQYEHMLHAVYNSLHKN